MRREVFIHLHTVDEGSQSVRIYRGWTVTKAVNGKWYAKTKQNGSGAGAMSNLVVGFPSYEAVCVAIDRIE